MKLSIVIPVYNERCFIAKVLQRIQRVNLKGVQKEIVIVEDFSTDGTREFLHEIARAQADSNPEAFDLIDLGERLDITNTKILFQKKNQGKGTALRRGFDEASGDVIVIQDADLEYNPEEYPKLLEPIQQGVADVVYGSRFLGGPPRVLYFWHYIGNRFLTILSNMLSHLNLTDTETCYKMFRRDVLDALEIKQKRFGVEAELTAKIARMGCRIHEVPVSYYGRTYAEGKKIGWKDGVKTIYCIIRYNLFP